MVWHINASHRLARWARTRPNVAQVQLEQWTEDRNRRADVHVVPNDGARLALEARRELISDELWQARHRDYASDGVRDVWVMCPDTRIAVLFAEGTAAATEGCPGPAGVSVAVRESQVTISSVSCWI